MSQVIQLRPRVNYFDDSDILGEPSPLDRPIAVTRFPSQAAKRKSERRLSLRQLAREIAETEADDKAGLPWFKLARFGERRTDKACLRNNANVLAVSGIEGDYDAGKMTPAEAHARLRRAGIAALLYTTPSHSKAAPRWRVLCPLSRECPPEDRAALLARLNGILGGVLDPASFTVSQSYYGGNVKGRPPVTTHLVDGRFLDEAADLDAGAIGPARDVASTTSAGTAPLGYSIEKVREAVMAVPNEGKFDDRDEWLRFLAAIHHETGGSEDGRALAHDWSARWKGGDDRKKTDLAWRSFRVSRPGGVTFRSIVREAREHGWTEIEFEDLGDEPEGKIEPPRASRLAFLSPDQCADMPARGYVLKGLLAPRDVGCIFGAPGAGKSLLAPHLGYAVARGAAAFRMRTRQGGVFYVAPEDPHGMRGRVTALRMTHGDAPGFTLIEGVSDLLSKGSPDLAALRHAIADRRPSLVIVDTLSMAFPGLEENTAEGMGRVVAVARKLTEHGAAVLLVHHDTKAEGATPRGHSVLDGALDMALQVTRDENGIVRGRLTKNRNGPCDLDVAFRIGVRELGEDEDGDPITAAIVDELAPGSAPRAEKLSAAEKAALDVLENLASATSDGVAEDAWRRACFDSPAVCASENRASRRQATNRAIAALFRKGQVELRDGRVERPSVGLGDLGWEDLTEADSGDV